MRKISRINLKDKRQDRKVIILFDSILRIRDKSIHSETLQILGWVDRKNETLENVS